MKVVILILTLFYIVTISSCIPIQDDPNEDLYEVTEESDYKEEISEDFNLLEKREISAKLSEILKKVGKNY